MSFAAAHDRHMDPPDPPDWDTIDEQAHEAASSDVLAALDGLQDALADARRVCEQHGVDADDCGIVWMIDDAMRGLGQWVKKPGKETRIER